MSGVLDGLRVIEGSAYVAAPLGGMTLAQLGADVIRFDPIGGGLDRDRWPVTAAGRSLFWAGMNKGKRSIQVDFRSPAGRELIAEMISAPGPDAGLFLTNFPLRGWLDPEVLSGTRPDLITVNIEGNHDGSSEVDYTIDPATGFPWATGPRHLSVPFNHLLPAWDAITGGLAATGLLAAERHRRLTGEGQVVKIALSDVALAMVGNLGKIAEVQVNQTERPKDGNYLYGAFGRDFATRGGMRIMIVALTLKQWESLVAATGLAEAVKQTEKMLGLDLKKEGDRFAAREVIGALIKPWTTSRTLARSRRSSTSTASAGGPTGRLPREGRAPRALLAREPDVRGGPPPRDRELPDAEVAAAVRAATACRSAARRCSASTPTRSSRTSSDSPTPRAGASMRTASWRASRGQRPPPQSSEAERFPPRRLSARTTSAAARPRAISCVARFEALGLEDVGTYPSGNIVFSASRNVDAARPSGDRGRRSVSQVSTFARDGERAQGDRRARAIRRAARGCKRKAARRSSLFRRSRRPTRRPTRSSRSRAMVTCSLSTVARSFTGCPAGADDSRRWRGHAYHDSVLGSTRRERGYHPAKLTAKDFQSRSSRKNPDSPK